MRERERFQASTSSATVEQEVHSNSTLGPDASLEVPTGMGLLSRDTTSAPEIGEEEAREQAFAPSSVALLDKYLLSKLSVEQSIFVAGLAVCGWIFIQDNGANRLNDWNTVIWTVQKSAVVLSIALLAMGILWLYKRFTK